MNTLCLQEYQAKRILQLQQAHQNLLLKIQQKQELISLYSRLVQTFDSLDPGIRYYFKIKLQTLVVKLTSPASTLSDRSIMSKLKKTSSSLLTRSMINSQEKSKSFLYQKTHRPSSRQESEDLEQDSHSVIENEFKILEELQEHKQETIKSTLTSQQEMIAKRLKQRKQKGRRKSLEKPSQFAHTPLLNKEELKRMQRDLTKKIKRMTARLSQMESLKAFSQRLVNNPSQLDSIRNQKICDRIEQEDEQSSDKENN